MSANVDNGYDRLPQRFLDHPRAYDLWQAYVLLESCGSEAGDDWRFGFPASLSFPVSEIEEMRQEEDALRLDITLPGVFGPDGPLPPDFRETVIQERNEGNRVLQDFLDLFQNRLMRLWMEDAAAMCPELGVKKEDRADLPDVFWRALSGMFVSNTDESELSAADVYLWAEYPLGVVELEKFLEERFGVEMEQFRGEWMEIPALLRTSLGSCNTRLGADAIIGNSVFDIATNTYTTRG